MTVLAHDLDLAVTAVDKGRLFGTGWRIYHTALIDGQPVRSTLAEGWDWSSETAWHDARVAFRLIVAGLTDPDAKLKAAADAAWRAHGQVIPAIKALREVTRGPNGLTIHLKDAKDAIEAARDRAGGTP